MTASQSRTPVVAGSTCNYTLTLGERKWYENCGTRGWYGIYRGGGQRRREVKEGRATCVCYLCCRPEERQGSSGAACSSYGWPLLDGWNGRSRIDPDTESNLERKQSDKHTLNDRRNNSTQYMCYRPPGSLCNRQSICTRLTHTVWAIPDHSVWPSIRITESDIKQDIGVTTW
jgi:hypothetical protein